MMAYGESSKKGLSRRAVAGSLAWTIPVIAVGAVVPAFAASPPVAKTFPKGVTQYPIPAGTTSVRYTVTGAGGANTPRFNGGSGATQNGTITLSGAATTLTVVVGAAGANAGLGGAGFGNGGSAASTLDANDIGRGGGGGSAVLNGTAVLVASGGGGGAGAASTTGNYTGASGIGGDAYPSPAAGAPSVVTVTAGGAQLTANGGNPPSGTTGGTAGTGGTPTTAANLTRYPGNAGGNRASGANGGANGGAGAVAPSTAGGAGNTVAVAGGGGGGGYAGGGSGAAAALNPGGGQYALFAGGGAGGGNYTAPTGVNVTSGSSANNPGGDGSITLTY